MGKLVIGIALLGLLVTAQLGRTQDYPARPVMMIVPHAPGGGADFTGRIVAERMRETLGQSVVVENVPAAAGAVGVERAARAAPDGYTIAVGDQTSFVVSSLISAVRYDVLKDFEPVALLTTSPAVLVARIGVPDKLGDLIARLRASPGSVSIGTFGKGSGPHILAVAFETMTGTHLQIVPYRGVAPALHDLVAGRLDLQIVEVAGMLPHLRGGKLKAYAVLTDRRSPAAPEVPTIEEAGGPRLHFTTWRGLWAPKGTPADVVAKLNRAVATALADPALQRRVADLGQDVVSRDQQTPQALAAHHRAEMEKWRPMVEAASARPD
ncbi:MAG: tripartite tricarboxylate transporter substrate binding protein [Xanthobacteraceae bacterium]|nr:tripartite tricarboxylate transporter substrate binding protein [Xanthobacteraceae bacterium]